VTDNPFLFPTTTTTTLYSFVILHILGPASNFFSPHTLDTPLCHLHVSIPPPFLFFKVSLILPYTSSFVLFLDKDGLQHFIHMLHSIQCISPKPLRFSRPLPLHSSRFIHTSPRAPLSSWCKTAKFPCNLSVPSPMLYYPIPFFPSLRTRSTWMITHK
jgi:hypothetical protein